VPIKDPTTRSLLRLAKDNEEFREELLGAMRRMKPIRDFAVDRESQEVLLTGLKAGDTVRISFETGEGKPSEDVTRAVMFDYDPADRSVELASPDGREMLVDRGQSEGVVYEPARGRAYPLVKIKHVRSVV
jgi:hypothetical protein